MEALGAFFLMMVVICLALIVVLIIALRQDPSTIGPEARRFVKEHDNFFLEFLMPLWPYLIICVSARIVLGHSFPLLGALMSLPELYLTAVFAIAWHRCVLLGADRKHRVNMWMPKKSEVRFFLTGLLLAFVPGLLIGVITAIFVKMNALIGFVLMVVSVVLAIYWWLRLVLVLPAMAIDRPISFAEARNFTKGKVWQLFLAIVSAVWPTVLKIIAYTIIVSIFLGNMDQAKGWMLHVRPLVIELPMALYFNFQITAGMVTVLSRYYRQLKNGEDTF